MKHRLLAATAAFALGPQGQERRDLPQGEILLQGALDALERSLAFVKSGRLSN